MYTADSEQRYQGNTSRDTAAITTSQCSQTTALIRSISYSAALVEFELCLQDCSKATIIYEFQNCLRLFGLDNTRWCFPSQDLLLGGPPNKRLEIIDSDRRRGKCNQRTIQPWECSHDKLEDQEWQGAQESIFFFFLRAF
ncbi:hypothetical protein IV203_030128 [Nitzschia inconspicua]|uniref:Uncharacterized protein n=1 Tax=Nitzschia inconspicua TaxID=303405 RepID=A0A9K3LSI6_9STRA|nr:hypothetical protein IV203_030128 [Nitzschia inconspicua]